MARCSSATPSGGLDHGDDASADGLGESTPGVDDGGQIGVGLTDLGGKMVGNGRLGNP
jgi:hypothetical protein